MNGIIYRASLAMRRYGIKPIYIILLSILLVIGITVIVLDYSISPALEALACTKLSSSLSESITEAISRAAEENIIDSDSLYEMQKDEQGNIKAVSLNASAANRIKTQATKYAQEEIKSAGQVVKIPVGNALGGNLFSGRGREINIRLLSVGKVINRLETEFKEQGINQTLLTSKIIIEANVTALVDGKKTDTTVNSEILLAEIVIVGKIPQRLTTVDVIDEKTSAWLESYRTTRQ